jgi:hypothetical protein
LLVFYPLIYELAFAQPRYRHAIEPEMLLLGTFFVYQGVRDFAARFAMFREKKSGAELLVSARSEIGACE